MTNPDEKPQNPPEFGGFAPQIVIELSFVEIGVQEYDQHFFAHRSAFPSSQRRQWFTASQLVLQGT
jgi:hypothetical protein